MGADDSNEGNGPGLCLEHEWVLTRAVLDGHGALRVFLCRWCGAEAVQPASGDGR